MARRQRLLVEVDCWHALVVQKIGKSRNKHSSFVLFKRRVIVPEAPRHLFAELRIPIESLNRVIVACFGF